MLKLIKKLFRAKETIGEPLAPLKVRTVNHVKTWQHDAKQYQSPLGIKFFLPCMTTTFISTSSELESACQRIKSRQKN